MEILAIAGFILAIVAGALALLIPEPYRHFAVVCLAVAVAFVAAVVAFD